MRQAISVPRANLISLGVCLGKFSKTEKFRLHVTGLDILARYAKNKVSEFKGHERSECSASQVVRRRLHERSECSAPQARERSECSAPQVVRRRLTSGASAVLPQAPSAAGLTSEASVVLPKASSAAGSRTEGVQCTAGWLSLSGAAGTLSLSLSLSLPLTGIAPQVGRRFKDELASKCTARVHSSASVRAILAYEGFASDQACAIGWAS